MQKNIEMKHGAFSMIPKAADIPTTQEITNEDNAHHFFGYQGAVHFEFNPEGQTVNQDYYVEIRKRLREVVSKKDPNFGPVIEFSAMTMLQLTRCSLSSSFWPKNRWKYLSYFTDVAQSDLWLFRKIKFASNGRRFQDIEDVEKYDVGTGKLFHNTRSKNVSKSGSIVGLITAAQREYFYGDPSP
jgi:hypothetical protein